MKYNKIKDLREDHDYSQNFVSDYLGVKRSTYANWENGDNLIPLEIVDKLSLLYSTTLSFLLTFREYHQRWYKKPLAMRVRLKLK